MSNFEMTTSQTLYEIFGGRGECVTSTTKIKKITNYFMVLEVNDHFSPGRILELPMACNVFVVRFKV